MKKKTEKAFLSKAQDLEKKAFNLESSISRWSKDKKVSDAFLSAAREYINITGYLDKAISNYKDAVRHAEKEERNEIEKELENAESSKKRMLFKYSKAYFLFASLSIISLLSALFFVSFSLTGNVIGELTQENSRLIGVILFFLGLSFVFCYIKCKK